MADVLSLSEALKRLLMHRAVIELDAGGHSAILRAEAALAQSTPPWVGEQATGACKLTVCQGEKRCGPCLEKDARAAATGGVQISDERIREIFMADGFTIKEGQRDLKPYVYAAARAILSEAGVSELRAEVERYKADAERLDWLCEQYVVVRIPLRYGSKECFQGSPEDGDGETFPWNIRASIDAARSVAPGVAAQGSAEPDNWPEREKASR